VEKPPTKFVYSAGGVVFRALWGRPEIALVRSRQAWTLSKGLIEKGEKPDAAAIREVGEETGLTVQQHGKVGEVEFWYMDSRERVRYHKKVYYFLFEAIGGNLGDHDMEVEEVRFFPSAVVISQASYPKDKAILRQALAIIGTMNSPESAPPSFELLSGDQDPGR
jgi:8-oxo-dGTP pyrophosphatase MutT (NUDIX family)